MKTLIFIITILFNFTLCNSQTGWYLVNGGLGTQTEFHGLYFNDINTGYICGQTGKIYKTTNGGSNWQLLNTGTTTGLYSIKFINQNTGICVGDSGLIIKTTNAGQNWFTLNSNTSRFLSCIRFLNNDYAMVSGSQVMLKTTNCGTTWIPTLLPSSTYLIMRSVFPVNENVSFAAGTYNIVYAKILKTTNGGTTWDSIPIPFINGFNDIYFANINTGYAAGTNTRQLEKTTNGGLSWFLTNAPLTYVGSLQCFGPDTIFVTGRPNFENNYGASYSTNGGNTWYGQITPTSHTLRGIHMINSSSGYLAGIFSAVMKTTSSGFTEINPSSTIIPQENKLYSNYPNPFNPVTTISFDLHRDSRITIKIFDILGNEILRSDEFKKAGSYEMKFEGSKLSSGMYFYSLETDNFKDTKKMVLIK